MYQTLERLILASASPRRRELLTSLGISFQIEVSGIDETQKVGEAPAALVRRLALEKAKAISESEPDAWILGADTDVLLDGAVLGKPLDEADAERLLGLIQGRTHEVWGAIALICKSKNKEHVEAAKSLVTMAPMTAQQIRTYIKTKEPMDKAGAYAVQGIGASLVTKIEGSYTNVVGLDLPVVTKLLLAHKVIGLSL